MRICVEPIDTISNVYLRVSFDWRYDNDDNYTNGNDFNNGNGDKLWGGGGSSSTLMDPDPTEDCNIVQNQRLRQRQRCHFKHLTRELSHNVHMMVQNSMGSDLFLDLMVTLSSGMGGGGTSTSTGARNGVLSCRRRRRRRKEAVEEVD